MSEQEKHPLMHPAFLLRPCPGAEAPVLPPPEPASYPCPGAKANPGAPGITLVHLPGCGNRDNPPEERTIIIAVSVGKTGPVGNHEETQTFAGDP